MYYPLPLFLPVMKMIMWGKGDLSVGLNFNPSIVFYNPNPYNKMLGAEAVIHYKISAFSIMSGVGFSRMADIGSYQVNYKTNDSVGFYLRVVSFTVDPRNPGQITYVLNRKRSMILSRIMLSKTRQIIIPTSIFPWLSDILSSKISASPLQFPPGWSFQCLWIKRSRQLISGFPMPSW